MRLSLSLLTSSFAFLAFFLNNLFFAGHLPVIISIGARLENFKDHRIRQKEVLLGSGNTFSLEFLGQRFML